ncbi:hypothetical protein [Chitinilyticum litopenaei]|uniref:hypothetical protein n=1 Tax=Chitinilyticum litopenaei TaxID=1121276 RepID=UPI0004216782|nr:hypothetical protein [Chitinilyticum litopenaei]
MKPVSRTLFLECLLATLLGIALLHWYSGGLAGLFSGQLMVASDYPNSAAAHTFYLNDRWRWPLGQNPMFGGGNLYFSDTAPWFSLLAKVLQQTVGITLPFESLLVINQGLLGLFALLLIRQVSDHRPSQWLFVLLISANLITPTRMLGAQHIALAGNWVIVWACALALNSKDSAGKTCALSVLACSMAWLTHAYLGVMASGILALALVMRKQWLAALLSQLVPLALLAAFGVFHAPYQLAQGAAGTGIDLAAFVQSLNWGISGYAYAVNEPWQKDALVYLGTGSLAIGVLALIHYKKMATAAYPSPHINWQSLPPLLAPALLLAIIATAGEVRILGQHLATTPLQEWLAPIYQRFRVAGRFAIPLALVLILLATLLWQSRTAGSKRWWAGALLAAALQLADLWHATPHASHRHPQLQEQARQQQQALQRVLDGQPWSRFVYSELPAELLAEQRLLDGLLAQRGARYISRTLQARQDSAATPALPPPAGSPSLYLLPRADRQSCLHADNTHPHIRLCLR